MGLSLHISIVPAIMMVFSLQVWLPLGCVEEERVALLQLKDSLNYPNGTSLPSWIKGDARCCDWELLECSKDTGRVTVLHLAGLRNGELGDWYLNASLFLPFQELNSLYLLGNQIVGWVENKGVSQPFKMSKLEHLDLGYNRLDNSILSYVDELSSLKLLYIDYNRLEGLIDLKECSSTLETLYLSSNNITKVVASRGPTNLSALYLNNITAYGSSFQKLLQSLGAFPNLTKLDLRNNDLRGRILGDELRNLSSLEELVLDDCSLDENSLQSLGALSSLKNLSLQELSGVVSFRGFLNLKNLELLDLSYNTLNSSNILQTIGTMTSLKTLMLQNCSLNGQLPTSQGFLNLKNLELLDLSYNTLNSSNIFQTIGTMTSLKTLWLQGCSLNGQLPTGLCDLNHLQELNIRSNDLNGFLPLCLANLTSLQQLDLSSNYLKIPMSLSPLYNLSKLKYFLGSDNEIYAEEDDHNLSPKFQLEYLDLGGHGQGAGAFPKFLYHQFKLQSLGISNIQIKGEFPSWLIENNTYLQGLFLENCSLLGLFLLPRSSHVNLSILSISMNNFQGQIPAEIGAYFPGLQVLMMSDNGFDGIIPSSLGSMSSLQLLDLSHNSFNGSIPSSLGSLSSLQLLDLSNNFLTGRILSNNSLQGHIPGWIGNMSSLELSRNNLSGPLPPRFGASSKLRYVYLFRNKLQGPIAMEFDDSSMILALDLSHNNLSGRIPEWIGGLSNLRFLLLSHNNLEGEIPIQLCRLKQLRLIDLSHNYLSGNILSWTISTHPFPYQNNYNNQQSFAFTMKIELFIYKGSYQQSFEFTMKNVLLIYKGSIIQYFTGIDFSCNNFTGEIPPEIGNLSKIKVLNLSHNSLIGPIPQAFSRLKEIESLDLSYNKLEGEIPPQLTGLYSPAAFSVAHNNLSGKTPARVAQFATFEESCYKDNTFLCGEPLPKTCGPDMPPSPAPSSTNNEDNGGFMDMQIFHVSFGVAYIMVLLVIGAVLYINPYWRRAWFHFIEVSITNCYYFMVDNLPSVMLNKEWLSILISPARKFRETKGIMVNTFEELESHAINSFSNGHSHTPPVYPVGPILNLNGDGDRDVESDKSKDIRQWLDDKPLSSVVYLCFGSRGSFGVDQVKEIACGLEQSGHRFLWSLRQPPPKGKMEPPSDYTNPRDVLPEGFLDRTANNGKIIGWAPQIDILGHPSVGGFISHCGWNSVLESIWFGVPIATWPLYAEQQFNAFTLIVEMGLGVEIKMDYRSEFHLDGDENKIVSAGEIERGVRCLMELDNEKRERLKEMSGKSRKALENGGTSYIGLGRFIQDVVDNQP